MNQPIIIKAAEALQNYGFQALMGTQVVFVSEISGIREAALKTGVIIDDSEYVMPLEPAAWEKSVLCVEVVEHGAERLYPISADEQLVLLPSFISYAIEPMDAGTEEALKKTIQDFMGTGNFRSLLVNSPTAELKQPLKIAKSMSSYQLKYQNKELLAHIEELRFALIAINSEAKKQGSKFAKLVTVAAEQALLKTDYLSTETVDNCGGTWLKDSNTHSNSRATAYPAGQCKHGVILYGKCLNCTRESEQGEGGAA